MYFWDQHKTITLYYEMLTDLPVINTILKRWNMTY